jgi:2-oxoacid:acceptor oxidoreductase gamma subunit (pyruvate/2-ketoisovalerate family)
MIEIRFHGRGGQGVVTAAELLVVGAFQSGKEVQAFPFFGVERRGAPIMAFLRLDDQFIRTREQIIEPEWVVVLDDTLLDHEEVLRGTSQKTNWVVNTTKSCEEVKSRVKSDQVWAVNATQVAIKIIGKPIVNTAVLGALVKALEVVKIEDLIKAIKERFEGKLGDQNARIVEEVFQKT